MTSLRDKPMRLRALEMDGILAHYFSYEEATCNHKNYDQYCCKTPNN